MALLKRINWVRYKILSKKKIKSVLVISNWFISSSKRIKSLKIRRQVPKQEVSEPWRILCSSFSKLKVETKSCKRRSWVLKESRMSKVEHSVRWCLKTTILRRLRPSLMSLSTARINSRAWTMSSKGSKECLLRFNLTIQILLSRSESWRKCWFKRIRKIWVSSQQ